MKSSPSIFVAFFENINSHYGFFPDSTVLLKSPTFIKSSIKYPRIFFLGFSLQSLPNFPCPTVIQGPTFILFAKFSGLYFYFLPYVYSGVYSKWGIIHANYYLYNLINILQKSWQIHFLHHDHSKHPTVTFISQILS